MIDIAEKIRRHEAQLQQWNHRHQEQIIAHSAVIESLREIHSETTPKPQDCATMEPDEPQSAALV
jgi:hypothetical protein